MLSMCCTLHTDVFSLCIRAQVVDWMTKTYCDLHNYTQMRTSVCWYHRIGRSFILTLTSDRILLLPGEGTDSTHRITLLLVQNIQDCWWKGKNEHSVKTGILSKVKWFRELLQYITTFDKLEWCSTAWRRQWSRTRWWPNRSGWLGPRWLLEQKTE